LRRLFHLHRPGGLAVAAYIEDVYAKPFFNEVRRQRPAGHWQVE